MILRRVGNKSKLAAQIVPLFPQHNLYVEPFFGAGGMFFNKPQAAHNICNDLDGDVYNLFQVLLERPAELYDLMLLAPYHNDLFQFWKKNTEADPLRKAARFLFLSNYSYMGKSDTLNFRAANDKQIFLDNLHPTYKKLQNVQFHNADFRVFLKSIAVREPSTTFIYADPPYVGTGDNYSDSFTKTDHSDLQKALIETGCLFAISEFANDFVIETAKANGLHIHTVGERQSMKNRSTEILIMNYLPHPKLF